MRERKLLSACLVAVLWLAFCGTALQANGLNLNGVGSRAIAMGGAFIGLADDYSAAFWNPAGLTQMQKPQLALFGTDIIPSLTYKFSMVGIDAESKSKMYPSGALGYFKPLNDKLVIGLFGYVPSGTGALWDGNDLKALSGNKVLEWESMIAVITIAPAIAYKISDSFSLGATLNIDYGFMKLKRPAVAKMGPVTLAGQYDESTSAWGFGATIGMLFKPVEKLGIGLTFRTPTKIKFKGDATNKLVPLMGLAETSDIEREATWPMWIGFGLSYKATDKLTVVADAQYTNWKKLDSIPATFSNAPWQAALAEKAKLVFNWENKLQYRFGLEYWLSQKFALRGGYYYDPAPSPVNTLSILLPSITYNAFTVGFGYKTEKINLDFCLEYLTGKDRELPYGQQFSADTGMPGVHGASLLVPNIAFTFYL